jgi:hypothetical protein
LVGLFAFLAIRAHDPYHWSDWEFGDAQTMLSLRQWQEGGWLNNHLLFKPQGYAAVIDLLDEPELRHHAHGISLETSPRVGPRLLYTHFPAGYLIPYATLVRLGLDGIFPLRVLSILFSLGAVALMYGLFALLMSPGLALTAVLFYALSPAFLNFADSLANQPIDDLLRFGFMLAVVFSTRCAHTRSRKHWAMAAWGIQFLLSLVSFDSVFFLYLWLIGWDLVEQRGFRWRRYLLYALAPLLAHSLQFMQNVWYLGWADAGRDIVDTFALKNGAADRGVGGGRVETVLMAVVAVCYMVYSPGLALLVLLALYMAAWHWLRLGQDQHLPSPRLLWVLLCCGLGFVVVLPRAVLISAYEGRQLMPFAAALVSGLSWQVVAGWRAAGVRGGEGRRQGHGGPWPARVFLGLATVVLAVFWLGFLFSNRFPHGPPEFMPDILLAQELQTLPTRHEPVYFSIGGFSAHLDAAFVPGYPQIRPETEYYAGSRPILCFADPKLVAKDLAAMVRKGAAPFSPVLLADSAETMAQVLAGLSQAGVLTTMPTNMEVHQGRVVLDLTLAVNWRAAGR